MKNYHYVGIACTLLTVPSLVLGAVTTLSIPTSLSAAPGHTVEAPVSINEGTGVTSIRFTLDYDTSEVLAGPGSPGPNAPAGSAVTTNTATPGVVTLTFTSPTALPTGSDVFADIDFSALSTASPESVPLDFVPSSISVNGGAFSANSSNGAITIVPEPATTSLACVLLAATCLSARRRRGGHS